MTTRATLPFETLTRLDQASTGTAQECDQAIAEWAAELGSYGKPEPSATELRLKVAAFRPAAVVRSLVLA